MASKNIKKRESALPWVRKKQNTGSRQTSPTAFDYNSQAWRKTSAAWRALPGHELCPVGRAMGMDLPTQVTDHIIRIEEGGAPWDENNFMAMSKYWHDKKSAYEKHHGTLVPWILNQEGQKIPRDKNDIIEYLKAKAG